jgi:hypothetical protein
MRDTLAGSRDEFVTNSEHIFSPSCATTGYGGDDNDEGARRSRPKTERSYGIPENADGMLSWEFVREKMANDQNYWVVTTRPDGRPHARPTWGV